MTRFLYLLFAVGQLSFPVLADTAALEKTAVDLNYGVDIYQCDNELYMLQDDQKPKKEIASVYRICFEPNRVATDAGVGIKGIESWGWSTSHKDGEEYQPAVVDGAPINGLAQVKCINDGKKCSLVFFLGTNFYKNAGSVIGEGEVSFTEGSGTVPAKFSMFSVQFSVKFQHSDGIEMSPEEQAELMKQVNEHNAAVKESSGEANAEL